MHKSWNHLIKMCGFQQIVLISKLFTYICASHVPIVNIEHIIFTWRCVCFNGPCDQHSLHWTVSKCVMMHCKWSPHAAYVFNGNERISYSNMNLYISNVDHTGKFPNNLKYSWAVDYHYLYLIGSYFVLLWRNVIWNGKQ